MNQSETLALASQAAALMEQFERSCADLGRQQQRLVQHLEQVTQSLPGVTVRSVQETLQRVPDALIRQVQNGLDESVAGFEKRLQHAGNLISGARSRWPPNSSTSSACNACCCGRAPPSRLGVCCCCSLAAVGY